MEARDTAWYNDDQQYRSAVGEALETLGFVADFLEFNEARTECPVLAAARAPGRDQPPGGAVVHHRRRHSRHARGRTHAVRKVRHRDGRRRRAQASQRSRRDCAVVSVSMGQKVSGLSQGRKRGNGRRGGGEEEATARKPGTTVWGPSSGRRSLWHGLVSVHLVQRRVTSRKGVHSEGGTIGGCGSVTALGSWCVGCSRVEAELAV